jgi:hypothetical protein
MRHLSNMTRYLALACGLGLTAVAPAAGQIKGEGFLFRRPVASLTLRGGFAVPQARSDVFDFTFQELTLDRRDFRSGAFGASVAWHAGSRVDLAFGVDYAGRNARSEFRDWVDQDDLPIQQTTQFLRVPVTASVRLYLEPRGREVGRLAWVPDRFSVYVGAGGGALWYRFRQRGDFVDFDTFEVFFDEFESEGWTPVVHLLGGFDYSLGPLFFINTDVRYSYARADLGTDFSGFDPIDLSGVSGTIGLGVRF